MINDFGLLLIIFLIIGILVDRKEQKDLKAGKIKGVRRSKGLFDWLFYNYVD